MLALLADADVRFRQFVLCVETRALRPFFDAVAAAVATANCALSMGDERMEFDVASRRLNSSPVQVNATKGMHRLHDILCLL